MLASHKEKHPMKLLVAVLAGLAALKIYSQDHVYREAISSALINAYKERAISACQKDGHNQPKNARIALWAKPSAITITVGRDDIEAHSWNTSDEQWNAAYKKPYLVLQPADPLTLLRCTYDITSGLADVKTRDS